MTDRPGYLIVGGEVFDDISKAPATYHSLFLRMLRDLRRNPRVSETVEIDRARGDWGGTPALLASANGLTVSYHVADRYVFLLLAAWV